MQLNYENLDLTKDQKLTNIAKKQLIRQGYTFPRDEPFVDTVKKFIRKEKKFVGEYQSLEQKNYVHALANIEEGLMVLHKQMGDQTFRAFMRQYFGSETSPFAIYSIAKSGIYMRKYK
jgi:hypothetical protein